MSNNTFTIFKWESPVYLDGIEGNMVLSISSEPLTLGLFTFRASVSRRITNGMYRPELKVTLYDASTYLRVDTFDSFDPAHAQQACDTKLAELLQPLKSIIQ